MSRRSFTKAEASELIEKLREKVGLASSRVGGP
jgi:hypothetical protein